jgi:ParB family transcriptional regulator, chromosome partitioning protein
MTKRKSLGRGLEALLTTHGRQTREEPSDQSGASLKTLPVDLLKRGRYQPRLDMREETLTELAESIRAQGIVQPIVVRSVEPDAGAEARYEIVAGERRWRAAQLAGLHEVPVVIREIPDEAAVAVALIENIQRENLNPLEEAGALKRLIEEFGMTHARAAEAVGRSRASVTNLLRLLELPEPVRDMLARRELDMGHARALLGLESSRAELIGLAQRIVKQNLSVRETENLVRRAAGQSSGTASDGKAGKTPDPNVSRLESELSEKLGTAVRIEHGRGGGRLVIRYHSLEELDGIIEHIR